MSNLTKLFVFLSVVLTGAAVSVYFWDYIPYIVVISIIGGIYIYEQKKTRENNLNDSQEARSNRDSVSESPRMPWIYWIISPIYLYFLVNFIGSQIDWEVSNLFEMGDKTLLEQAKVFVPIFFLVMSITYLDRTESASLKLYGLGIMNLGPGPKFIPWLVFQYTVYTRASQQRQHPADPDDIFKGPDELPLPPNKVRALRITTGRPEDGADKTNPLDIQMALEFLYFLRIEIYDPLTFEVKYGDLEGFWGAVRDTGDKLLNAKVTKMPGVAALIENTETLMDQLHEALDELCRKGGVKVIESGISAPDLTHALSEALRNIGVVRAEAGAEAGKIVQVETAKGAGAASIINQTSKALKEADPSAKAAYVGKEAIGDKTTLLGLEGVTQLVGMAQHLTAGVKKGDTSSE